MTQTGTYTLNFRTPAAQSALRFGWKEWSGTKSLTVHVAFPDAFPRNPHVLVGLTGFETLHDNTSSFQVAATDITPEGFNLVVSVSILNRAQRLDLQWLATDA